MTTLNTVSKNVQEYRQLVYNNLAYNTGVAGQSYCS